MICPPPVPVSVLRLCHIRTESQSESVRCRVLEGRGPLPRNGTASLELQSQSGIQSVDDRPLLIQQLLLQPLPLKKPLKRPARS